MVNNKIYNKARKNLKLINKDYSNLEIKEIVQGQFHYFWYRVNLGWTLEPCSYMKLETKEKNKIRKEIELFKKNNIHIFKNQLKSFNLTMLHLMLEIKEKEKIKAVKI